MATGQTKFTSFDSTTSPSTSDIVVGAGLVSGVTTNKRWTLASMKSFWQGILNITDLDREKANYVRAAGGAGSSVSLSAVGSAADLDLVLSPKGTGQVSIAGPVEFQGEVHSNGGDIETDGGDFLTSGGDMRTSGGDVVIGTGDLNIAGGTITLNGMTLSATGSTWNLDTTDVNLTSGDFNITGGNLRLSAGTFYFDNAFPNTGAGFTMNGDFTVVGDMDITASKTLTVPELIGNRALVPLDDIYRMVVTNGILFNDAAIFDTLSYHNDDVVCDTFIRGGCSFGQTADVTSVQGGGLIAVEVNEYSTVATIGDCATLPALTAPNAGAGGRDVYTKVIIINNGANAMDVFPNTGGDIDGSGANVAISVAAGAQVTLYGQDVGGTDTWFTVA